MQEKFPLSISLISFNEEGNIGRTLESIKKIASEIVVIDSHSTDKTREIAESFGAKVYVEDWKGFIAQKNLAIEKCTQEWILSLDCDEVVSEELKKTIVEKINDPDSDGYLINRKTYYMGKFLDYVWQPDWKLIMVKRCSNPKWRGYNPHAILEINGSTKKLEGYLFHYSFKNIEDHFNRTVKYARLAAQSYYEDGKKFKWYKMLFNPLFGFAKVFVTQRGFLDGFQGLIIASSSFVYVFLKYVFLWEIERTNGNN